MDNLMRFLCPACGKRLKAPPQHAGRKARCHCGQQVVIPGPTEPVAVGTEVNRWALTPEVAPTSDIPVGVCADFTTAYEFRARPHDLWQALHEYLDKVPTLQVDSRDEGHHSVTCRDAAGGTVLCITVSHSKADQSTVTIEEFRPPHRPDAVVGAASRLPLLTAAVRTVAFQKFHQIGGPGNAGELRMGGIWKMAIGAVIGVIGLGLTAASDGQVLFYGAILTGLFTFLGGVWQTAFAQNVD